MTDTAKIAGTLAGKVMSIIQGTDVYRQTAVIKGINFDDVAESITARVRGQRTVVDIVINDMVFHLMFRKNYLMYDREVWDTQKMPDIIRMLRYLQDRVEHHFVLTAAAGVL